MKGSNNNNNKPLAVYNLECKKASFHFGGGFLRTTNKWVAGSYVLMLVNFVSALFNATYSCIDYIMWSGRMCK